MSDRQQKILELLKAYPKSSFRVIFSNVSELGSERTIKRDISELVDLGLLEVMGGGRSIEYKLTIKGRLLLPISANQYQEKEPDKRDGVLQNYQFYLWQSWPASVFTKDQLSALDDQTNDYQKKVTQRSKDVKVKELERFVIELSWKSSRIEGNTYTLLDTERLLKEGIASDKNTKEETVMILNHKKAFDFVYQYDCSGIFTLTVGYIEQVHKLLMEELLTDNGFRKQKVGITGSLYQPLDNQFQIKEALEELVAKINSTSNIFDKAFLALVGISYIQPFVDGNKRTARLVANGILLAFNASPLSYRNVDEVSYRASLLVFYEQLSVVPMLEIFIEQYKFAVDHYT